MHSNRFFAGSALDGPLCAVLAMGALLLNACATTPEAREAKHMNKARQYFAAKKYREAAIEFKVASQNMPKDAEPLYQLGMTYLAGKAPKLAVDAFTKALAANPGHEGAQYQMALVKVARSKQELVEEARQTITRYVSRHPGDAAALGTLALASARLGDKPASLRYLTESTAKDEAGMRAASMVITVYLSKGDTDTARQISRDMTERFPKSADAAVLRARVSLATKDAADADAYIDRALSLRRDFQPALDLRLRRDLTNKDAAGAEETAREMSNLPEKKTASAYGRLLFAEHKYPEAKAEFERVLKSNPDNAAIRNEYSSLLTASGFPADADMIIGGTLARDPRNAGALLQRAASAINKGDIEAAAKDVKTLQELKAFSAPLSYQQARIMAARGDRIRQGDLLAEALKQDPRYLTARLDLSILLASMGKSAEALNLLDQAPAFQKQAPQFVFYRNGVLMANGKWTEARKELDAALARVRSPGFLYQDALLRARDHDIPGARKSIDEAFRAAPDAVPVLTVLGGLMARQGESAQFISLVRDAAASKPNSAPLQNMLGRLLLAQKDVPGARAAFAAAKKAGDSVNSDLALANLDLNAGDSSHARQRIYDVIRTRDNARAHIMLAELDKKSGSPDAVIQDCLKAIQLEPSNAIAMNNLAAYLVDQKKIDDAVFWGQKALGAAPSSPVVADTLGWALFQQGKYEAAFPLFEKSLKALDRPIAHYHLAAALAKTGDSVRGRKEFEIAVNKDPNSPSRAQIGLLFAGR